jgi:hypothetical protein
MQNGDGQLVEVSLAGTSKLLRSLGRKDGGFETGLDMNSYQEALEKYGPEAERLFEEKESELGTMRFLKHAGRIEGEEVGWQRMPRALGSSEAVWL